MKISKLAVLSVLGLAIISCDGKKEGTKKDVALTSKLDSVSYALGMVRSGDVKRLSKGVKENFGLTINKSAYILGFENGVDSTDFKIELEKGKKLLDKFGKEQGELAKKRKETNATPVDLPISADGSIKTVLDSVSYSIGAQDGSRVAPMKKNIKEVLDIELNLVAFKTGFFNGADSDSLNIKISEADSKTMLDDFFKAKQKEVNEKNKKIGEDFLEANKIKEGVKTTASGLQYSVINEGTGKIPTANSMTKVHYHGTLIDGTVFDSSIDRGTPAEFAVNGVIKGWTEGLQLMKEGSKYRFYIPQDLAYGSAAQRTIKPYSVLIFDLELIEVKAKSKEQLKQEQEAIKRQQMQQQQMQQQIQQQMQQQTK